MDVIKSVKHLSIRDFFATQAMMAVLQETQEMKPASFWDWCKQLMQTHLGFTFLTVKYIKVDNAYYDAAIRAYEYADMMLIAREETLK